MPSLLSFLCKLSSLSTDPTNITQTLWARGFEFSYESIDLSPQRAEIGISGKKEAKLLFQFEQPTNQYMNCLVALFSPRVSVTGVIMLHLEMIFFGGKLLNKSHKNHFSLTPCLPLCLCESELTALPFPTATQQALTTCAGEPLRARPRRTGAFD